MKKRLFRRFRKLPKPRKPKKAARIKAEKLPKVRKRKEALHLRPISDVARSLGIRKKYVELYGQYKAKISLDILSSLKKRKKGKYILITSLTPTPFGEGKTVSAIGLSMAFAKLKKRAVACIMQPALSGIFGMKGSASGAGRAQVFPRGDANLHLTGDNHAVESAHNLCAAYLENSIFNGNPLDIDSGSVTWKRVMDVGDRALRNISVGLGGKTDGISRKTGFDLTSTSELMAILALAENLKDLRERVGKIVLAFTKKGKPITCEDIKAAGAMTALLKDALKPNLLQTTEGTAAFMHTGAFGTTSLGTASTVADKIALGLSDYVLSESSFGADIGAEKFFDIKCRINGLKPDAAVIVCSVRALKMHSGDFEISTQKMPRELLRENISAVERGFTNLEKQIENVRTFGVPVVLCINRFSGDTEKEIAAITRRAADLGAGIFAVSDAYASGSEGAQELAKAVMEACKTKSAFRFLYPLDMPVKDKLRRIARTMYGAKDVVFSEAVNKKALAFRKLKMDNLPVCVAKTRLSLSHNTKRKGRPHGFKFPVDDIWLSAGAGFITALSGGIKMMPGLPKIPRGVKIDVNDEEKIIGL